MKLKRISWPAIRRQVSMPRRIAVVIVAGMVLLVGAYAFWSKHTWERYEISYTERHSSVQRQVDTAFALPVATAKERQAKFAALKNTSQTIGSAKNSLCEVNKLVGWQRFIEVLGTREQECQKILGGLIAFNKKLQAATGYLESEQALASIIGGIPAAKAELAEGDWEAQAAAWHDASARADKLSASDDFTPTKQAAHAAIKKIDAAWQEVLAAHKAKDKARYTKAQSQLVLAYGAVGNISDVSTLQLKVLLQSLQSAYDKAFK